MWASNKFANVGQRKNDITVERKNTADTLDWPPNNNYTIDKNKVFSL